MEAPGSADLSKSFTSLGSIDLRSGLLDLLRSFIDVTTCLTAFFLLLPPLLLADLLAPLLLLPGVGGGVSATAAAGALSALEDFCSGAGGSTLTRTGGEV